MSTVNETDLLLVERNGVQYQITYDEMSTLNDDDLLLVERNGVQYKVEAQHIGTAANGVILPEVEVLTPLDRAGDPELTYLKSDTILAVEDDGGSLTFETDTISSVALDRWVDNGSVAYAGTAGGAQDPTAEEVNLIFDGEWTTDSSSDDYFLINGTGGVDNLVTLTFNPPIAYNSKVEVLHYRTGVSGGQVYANKAGINGDLQTHPQSPQPVNWYEVASGSGSMSTLSFGGSYQSSNLFQSIRAIRVDGVELVNKTLLSFPSSNNFDKFTVGDVAQSMMETPMFMMAYPSGGDNTPENWQLGGFIGIDHTNTNTQTPEASTLPSGYRYFVGFYIGGSDLTVATAGTGWETYSSVDGVNWVQHATFSYNLNVRPHLASNPGARYFAMGSLSHNEPASTYIQVQFSSPTFFTPFEIEVPVNDTLYPRPLITAIDADATPDPTITVDGGVWGVYDDSEVWSTAGTITNDWAAANLGIDKAFNGILVYPDTWTAQNGTTSRYTFPSVQAGTKFELHMSVSLATTNFSVNGVMPSAVNVGGYSWVDVTDAVVASGLGGLQYIDISYFADQWAQDIGAIRIDGKMLVDTGVEGLDTRSISKTFTYSTKLTLAGDTDLAQMSLGPAVMTDGVLGGSGYSQTPYTLTTTEIQSVDDTNPSAVVLSFPGDVSTNPDLRYFKVGSLLQGFEQVDWANVGTSSNWAPSVPLANAFDGSESTSTFPNPGTTGSYTFATPLSYSSKVEILAMASVTQDPNFRVNGQLVPLFPNDGKIWVDVTSILDGTGGTFQSFTTSYSSNNYLTYIYAIRVDGTILSNNGVSTAVKVVSTDLATNTMVVDGGEWGTYDDSQVWSQQVTPEPRTQDPATNMFDGTTNGPGCIPKYPSDGGTGQATFVFNNSGSSTVRLTGYVAGSGTSMTVNGSAASFDTDINFTGDLTLVWTSINGSNYHRIDSVTVDGKLLVDAVNDSQVWSSYGVGTPYSSVRNWDNTFNGEISTGGTGQTFPSTGETMTWTPPTPLTVNSEVVIYLYSEATHNCLINGSLIKTAPGAYGTPVSYTAAELGGQLTSIALVTDSPTPYGAYLTAVRVDGELLVDPGARNLDARQATTIIPGGTGDLVEIDAASNAVYLTEGDRAWIPSNNFAGTNFALAAGSLANPTAPDYLDIVFTSMNAGTTPFSGVDATLSSRTWTLETAPAKSGPWTVVDTYEDFDMTASQDGATPWTTGKPVLNQSTWYRVKVAYNSTAVDTPVESAYHTFKTGV